MGYGNEDDIIMEISSPGNSQNVIDARITAQGVTVIKWIGESGGKMKPFCDIFINVPDHRTAFVHKLHLSVCDTLCMTV